jgi:hypothetical protein
MIYFVQFASCDLKFVLLCKPNPEDLDPFPTYDRRTVISFGRFVLTYCFLFHIFSLS